MPISVFKRSEAFTYLGITVDVDFRRDFREICAVDLPEKKKVIEFPKAATD